ncbi:MAG: ScaI family restriction endonuclease [Candidatus Brocadiaceae bacterium]|nr:ScaI family restriction endonuclease [Candidatus Brocadiaceae bacterium]
MSYKDSPYRDLPPKQWAKKTRDLVRAHPLKMEEAVEVVLKVWQDILTSAIGSKPYQIGTDLLPKPQIMAFFLHELIPLELAARHPGIWRGDKSADEKDLVFIPNPSFSVEIKTSSHPTQIFGNRSYAQKPTATKKSKSGYYLAINFEKFRPAKPSPKITLIRFGWLDHKDWAGQKAATGQQARLLADVEEYKLLQLYPGE